MSSEGSGYEKAIIKCQISNMIGMSSHAGHTATTLFIISNSIPVVSTYCIQYYIYSSFHSTTIMAEFVVMLGFCPSFLHGYRKTNVRITANNIEMVIAIVIIVI